MDIRQRIIKLGAAGGGYDERGLLGLACHPAFYYNGLFYLHYSMAGTQGPGALSDSVALSGALPEFFKPNPCDPSTLNLKWTNREIKYDHIDTVEEWVLQPNGQPRKLRTLLNLRRPFFNHNCVNSLNFSPETGKLVLTTGDGGSGYDPFNLSQDNHEIAGKIIEIDVVKDTFIDNPPVVTRFNELPASIQETLTIIAKGVRNIPGISFQRFYNQYIKYVGQVGQDLVESVFSFIHYKTIPRPNRFGGTALTGVQVYMGNRIPGLTGSVVFIDFAENEESKPPVRGVLAYSRIETEGKLNDFSVIETEYNFGSQSAYYVSLGTNLDQTRLYLGVYGSMNVVDFHQGTIFEIVP